MTQAWRHLLLLLKHASWKLRRCLSDCIYPLAQREEDWNTQLRETALAREAVIACSEASMKAKEGFLKEQKKCRELAYKLEQMPIKVAGSLMSYCAMSTEELAQEGIYAGSFDEETGMWLIATARCQYGGCEMSVCEFQTERESIIFAAALEAVGHETARSICPACRAEYMDL